MMVHNGVYNWGEPTADFKHDSSAMTRHHHGMHVGRKMMVLLLMMVLMMMMMMWMWSKIGRH